MIKEFVYAIDPIASQRDKALVIHLIENASNGNYPKLSNNFRYISRQDIEKTKTAQDREALQFLFQEELKYQKKKLSPADRFSSFRIPHQETLRSLKLLAATGKLYFKDKQLVVDFYGKTTFAYEVETTSDAIKVEGLLSDGEKVFNLRETDFICGGPPQWYIKGIVLKFISTDVSWKSLKSLFDDTVTFTKADIAELKEAHLNYPEEPAIIFKNLKPEAPLKEVEPLPVLMLKDRTGAFADLFMDYQGTLVAFHDPKVKHHESEKGWEKDLLESDFIRKPMLNSHYYCPMDKVAKALIFLLEIGWTIIDVKGNKVVRHTDINVEFFTRDSFIQAKGKVLYETFQADIGEVAGAFNRRDRFIQIAPDTVGLIPDSFPEGGFDTLFQESELIQEGLKIKKHAFGSMQELLESKKITADSSLIEMVESLNSFQGIEQALPSPLFLGSLRDYQQTGVNWLNFLYEVGFNGILADDMGLGKTIQVLAFISRLCLTSPILIVLPTSLIFHWKREVERFTPSLKVSLHHGIERKKEIDLEANIILTSYTTLRLDIALFSKVKFQAIILDEAQNIKNAETLTAKSVSTLDARFKLCVTGTPIENHLGELWSHFNFLMPELLGDKVTFNGDLAAGTSDMRYLQRIKKKIRPFILRRTKEQVAKDLPERIEQYVYVDMPEAQRLVYDQFVAEVKGNLIKKVELEGMGKHRIEVLEAILRLRQICCHPLLVSTLIDESIPFESGKLELLLEDIETAVAENRKVLIYSQFTSMLQIIAKALKRKNLNFAYLDGSTKNREEVVLSFQNDPTIPLFLISLKAGGVGLNLTAADYVLLFDPWWNDAVENQAINRAHRIGRKDTVIAKRYITLGSVEEKMLKLKSHKTTLTENILEDNDLSGTDFTFDDFKFLIS